MNSDIFWNRVDLAPPEKHVYKLCDDKPKIIKNNEQKTIYKRIEHQSGNIVQQLLNLCSEIKESVNGLGSLNIEGAALSRLIYRIKGRLRCDKGLQSMLKVNRCLVQYLNLNILKELAVVQEPLSDDVGPSRQMLQWFLVRLQGLAQLFHRTYKTCLEAAEYLTLRMKTGHLWSVALIALAIVSRIWTVSRYMIQSVCGWYVDLYSYLDKLKPSPKQWLPEDYVLPQDLIKFLGEPSFLVKKQSRVKDSVVFSQLTKDAEEQLTVTAGQNDTFNCVFGLTEDMGEHISRDHINSLETRQNIVSGKRKANHFDEEHFKCTDVHDVAVPRKKKKKKTSLHPQEIQGVERTAAPVELNRNNEAKNKANRPKKITNANIKEVKSEENLSHVEVEENLISGDSVATKKKKRKRTRKKKSVNVQEIAKGLKSPIASFGGNEGKKNVGNESEFHKNKSEAEPNKEAKSIPKIDSIRSYHDLFKFIKAEQYKRTHEPSMKKKKYLTKNLDNLQFQMFSNFITKYLTKMKDVDNERKLSRISNDLRMKMYEFLSR